MSTVVCTREPGLGVDAFRQVLVESGLGATRPVDDPARLRQMLLGAGLIMTARSPEGRLLGVARCLSDGAWVAYLAELAVSRNAQGRGVGRQLLKAVRDELGPTVSLVLASVPEAVGFCEQLGMPRLPDAFCDRRER